MNTELLSGFSYTPQQVLVQREPMLLLDSIDTYGPDWVEASLTVRPDAPFATVDGMPAWVGIEYMAQTASAFSGILQRQSAESPSIALLLGARRFDSEVAQFGFGTRLKVRADLLMLEASGLAAFECTIRDAMRCLCRAQIKAYRPQDIEDFMKEHS